MRKGAAPPTTGRLLPPARFCGGLGRGGFLLLLGVTLGVQGCAIYDYLYGGPPRREAGRSDQDLLRSAEANMEKRRYEAARKDLQQLLNQYPESDLQAAARLGSAKAFYLEKKYDEAKVEYHRFLELYPQHEGADEAHYYLGMANFRQADAPDRDQTSTRKALEEFDLLLSQMPDSPYAADARERQAVARKKLAEREVLIGRFYFDRGEYAAAAGRFSGMLAQYDKAGFDDQALYYLGESLWRLEQKDQARVAFLRVVDEHSQSEWAATAAERIEVPLVRTGPPPPKGPGLFSRVWQGLKEGWVELTDTLKDYRLFP